MANVLGAGQEATGAFVLDSGDNVGLTLKKRAGSNSNGVGNVPLMFEVSQHRVTSASCAKCGGIELRVNEEEGEETLSESGVAGGVTVGALAQCLGVNRGQILLDGAQVGVRLDILGRVERTPVPSIILAANCFPERLEDVEGVVQGYDLIVA